MYREQLGVDGKTLLYRLPAEGGATPGTPAALDGTPILEPYAGLEVRSYAKTAELKNPGSIPLYPVANLSTLPCNTAKQPSAGCCVHASCTEPAPGLHIPTGIICSGALAKHMSIVSYRLSCSQSQPLQQKRLAARRHNTTYCYDFPSVFDNALRGIWAARAAAGEPQSVPPPGKLVEAHELVLAGEHSPPPCMQGLMLYCAAAGWLPQVQDSYLAARVEPHAAPQ